MVRPIIVCTEEGGVFRRSRNIAAPIRIYHDRRVQDDIYTARTGRKWRSRFTRADFRLVKKAAQANSTDGRI